MSVKLPIKAARELQKPALMLSEMVTEGGTKVFITGRKSFVIKSLSVPVGSFCASSLSFNLIIFSVCDTRDIRQMQACLVTLKLAITCQGTRSPLGQPIPRAERKRHKEHCPEQQQQQKVNLGTEEHLRG